MTAPLSPRAAELLAQLGALNRSDDALELRIAVTRQQLKAAEARATTDPAAAILHVQQAEQALRRAA